MTQFIDTLVGIFQSSGFAQFGQPGGWLYAVMICVGCFLLYLAIVKEFEPLILLPMAFGMILANLPGSGIIHMQYFVGDGLEHPMWVEILNNGGLADMLYMGVKLGIYPPLIFLGIGTMTDFAPLISNPKSLLLGAAAQFGIFGTYMGARLLVATGLVDFTQKQSAAISIIGGADGPTDIVVSESTDASTGEEANTANLDAAVAAIEAVNPIANPRALDDFSVENELMLTMDNLVAYKGDVTNDQADCGLVFVAQAKDGQVDAVKSELEAYKASLSANDLYAEFADKIALAKDARIVTNGNYVAIVIAGIANPDYAAIDTALETALNF